MTTQLSIPENALSEKTTQPFTALCFTTHATLQTLPQLAYGVAEDIHREVTRLGLDSIGPIQWIYAGVNNDETNEFQLKIALPIQQPGVEPDGFSYNVFPAFRCATYTYTGPWSDFGQLYAVLFGQLYRAGLQNDGHNREMYSVIDAENPENCVTEIQIGLI